MSLTDFNDRKDSNQVLHKTEISPFDQIFDFQPYNANSPLKSGLEAFMSEKIGFARASTAEQSIEEKIEILENSCCNRISMVSTVGYPRPTMKSGTAEDIASCSL